MRGLGISPRRFQMFLALGKSTGGGTAEPHAGEPPLRMGHRHDTFSSQMSNSKTRNSASPKPESKNGWVHKCDLDDYLGRHFPIPTQVVSNEEFYPLPQTAKQRAMEHRMSEMASANAKKMGMDRRRFLGTSCGMAMAFAAMNSVFGHYFKVNAAEMFDPAAAAEGKKDYFIFDVQTHHVEVDRWKVGGVSVLEFRRLAAAMNPDLRGREPKPEDVYLENYIKGMFLDSDTDVAVISGVPSLTDDTNILPPEKMATTCNWINTIAKSRRMVAHGLMAPDLGAQNKENMHVQAEKLKLEAWKVYTGLGLGADKEGWWLDDEKVSYPALETARKLKIKNICTHKGLALGLFNEAHCHPKDLVNVSKDFGDMNFLVYHSGFK